MIKCAFKIRYLASFFLAFYLKCCILQQLFSIKIDFTSLWPQVLLFFTGLKPHIFEILRVFLIQDPIFSEAKLLNSEFNPSELLQIISNLAWRNYTMAPDWIKKTSWLLSCTANASQNTYIVVTLKMTNFIRLHVKAILFHLAIENFQYVLVSDLTAVLVCLEPYGHLSLKVHTIKFF